MYLKKNSKRLKKLIANTLNENTLVLIVFIIIFFILTAYNSIEMVELFDLTIITSIVVSLIVSKLLLYFSKKIQNDLEDSLKLSDDIESLITFYKKEELVNIGGIDFPAVVLEKTLFFNKLEIEDIPDRMYNVPEIVSINYKLIFGSHSSSSVYNNLNIRLDDCNKINDILVLKTSRTTYFNSLVTNRALDYNLGSSLTLRKVLQYDNRMGELSNSSLSNHLGFNVFLITKDDNYVFVKRKGNLSIAKNVYGCAVSASLKSEYALNNEGKLTVEKLVNAIKNEMMNELCLEDDDYEVGVKNIVCVYRDLVEGGKPQLLIYVGTHLLADELKQKFKVKKFANDMKRDGDSLLFISKEKMKTIKFGYDFVAFKRRKYPFYISTISCFAILKNLGSL